MGQVREHRQHSLPSPNPEAIHLHTTREFFPETENPSPMEYFRLLRPSEKHEKASKDWQRFFSRMLLLTDSITIITVTGLGYLISTGQINVEALHSNISSQAILGLISCFGLIWITFLGMTGSRNSLFIDAGATEFQRVVAATAWLFILAATFSAVAETNVLRSYLLITLPLGLVMLLFQRWFMRIRLVRAQRKGLFLTRTVVVGSVNTTKQLLHELSLSQNNHYLVCGAVVVEHDQNQSLDLPVPTTQFTRVSDILSELNRLKATTIILTGSDHFSSTAVRELSWRLVPGRQRLLMTTNLVDVAGRRVTLQQISRTHVVHIEPPLLSGIKYAVKRFIDIVGSLILLVVLSPLFLVTSLAIKFTSAGPVFFCHERIGRDGTTFRMFKFRSMVSSADLTLASLLKEQGNESVPLFKIKDDPRITPIGRIIRRLSIDETPQLLNVLLGHMSLVGPRPQVDAEVKLYDHSATRRLLIKPGMTGLWQVSGRSRLSWEESIRLDLYYVDNWSLAGDLSILWRTVRAVLARDGAI